MEILECNGKIIMENQWACLYWWQYLNWDLLEPTRRAVSRGITGANDTEKYQPILLANFTCETQRNCTKI